VSKCSQLRGLEEWFLPPKPGVPAPSSGSARLAFDLSPPLVSLKLGCGRFFFFPCQTHKKPHSPTTFVRPLPLTLSIRPSSNTLNIALPSSSTSQPPENLMHDDTFQVFGGTFVRLHISVSCVYSNALLISVIPASISIRPKSLPVTKRTLFSCAIVIASAEKASAVDITHGIAVYSSDDTSC